MGEFIMDDQRIPLPKGKFLEYEIIELIGYGGSSLCYLVSRNHTFFIMKELYPQDLVGYLLRKDLLLILRDDKLSNVLKLMDQSNEDFLLEAQISRELSHVQRNSYMKGENPYFSSLHDHFKVVGSLSYYLVYQSLQGMTLDNYNTLEAVDKQKKLIENLNLLSRLSEAVEEIHNHNYLHLDLKSDNIYVVAYETPTIQLLDMGSAIDRSQGDKITPDHLIRRISYNDRYSSPRLRDISKLKRDLFYIQATGISYDSQEKTLQWLESKKSEILAKIHQLDESDDIFSLYVIMSEMITGERFDESSFKSSILTSEQLNFLSEAIKEDFFSRISKGMDFRSDIKTFKSDIEEIREIVKSEGIHFVMMRSKCQVDFLKKFELMKYEIQHDIFAECEVLEANSIIVYDDLKEFINDKFPNDIEKNIVILGEGGSGKSTQLMNLWEWLLKVRQNIVPFHIPLIDFQMNHFKHLTNYVLHHFGGSFTDSQRDRLFKLFEDDANHQYVFLLDGFNETSQKDELYKEIQELSKFPRVKIIITSRVEYSGFLDYCNITVQNLTWNQVSKYAIKTGISNLEKNEFYRNPMMLTLVCKSNEFLKGNLIPQKDLNKLDIQNGNNRMELILNYFIAQKIKHFLKFGHNWSDKNVITRLIAYDVILPQIAKIFYKMNSNSLPRDEIVEEILNYLLERQEIYYRSPLMNKVFQYRSLFTANFEFVNNSLIIDLLGDELSILIVGDRVSFRNEVFQEFFLAYQISKEIKFQDKSTMPLLQTHLINIDHLKNVGDLLHEHRFADPRVSCRNKSYVELFLNEYRNIFDGSTKLLVKNAFELMKVARNGLILADLSYLDLTQSKLAGSIFSTIGEIESIPATFRGSHLMSTTFKTVEHRSHVDRIIVSSNNKLAASFSIKDCITKIWNIDTNELISEIEGKHYSSIFIDDVHILSYNRKTLQIHNVISGETVSTSHFIGYLLTMYNFNSYDLCIMDFHEGHVYIGCILSYSNDENSDSIDTDNDLHIFDFDVTNLKVGYPEEVATITTDDSIIYGFDYFINHPCLFRNDKSMYIIRLSEYDQSKEFFRTKIEIVDIYDETIFFSLYANIKSGCRFFYSKALNSIVFSVINEHSKQQSIISINMENRSIRVLGINYSAMVDFLGICDISKMMYFNDGGRLMSDKFADFGSSSLNKFYSMHYLGYGYRNKYLNHFFIINNGKVVFLHESNTSIMKIEALTGNKVSNCLVSRDSHFRGLYFDDNLVYLVFPRKYFIFDLNKLVSYKSLVERGTDFFLHRKIFLDNVDDLKVKYDLVCENKIRSCSELFGHIGFDSYENVVYRVFNYQKENEYRIEISRDFKMINKYMKVSDKQVRLDLTNVFSTKSYYYKIIGTDLLILDDSNLVVIDFDTLKIRKFLFNTDKTYNLKRISDYDFALIKSIEFLLLIQESKLLVFLGDYNLNSDLKLVGIIDSVKKACLSDDSIFVVHETGELIEYELVKIESLITNKGDVNIFSIRKIAALTCFDSGNYTSVIDLGHHNQRIIVVTSDMFIHAWDSRSSEYIGKYEMLDTNLRECDFTDTVFTQ
jgi:serine/threonine protein kinase